MKTCATCRKLKVCEFSPSAESLFKYFPNIIQTIDSVSIYTCNPTVINGDTLSLS